MKSALAQLVEPFMPTEGVPKRKEYLNSYKVYYLAFANTLHDLKGQANIFLVIDLSCEKHIYIIGSERGSRTVDSIPRSQR